MIDLSFPLFARIALERLLADESLRTPAQLDLLLDAYAKQYAMDPEPHRQQVHAWCKQRFEAFRLASSGKSFARQFRVGRQVAAALPGDCSVLRPSAAGLRDAAKACGLSERAARRALDAFNYGGAS